MDTAVLHRRLHKFRYYLRHIAADALPRGFSRKHIDGELRAFAALAEERQRAMLDYVQDYNRLSAPFALPDDAARAGSFRDKHPSAYYYDLAPLLRYFPQDCRFCYEFGDVIRTPTLPAFVKSRPIHEDNANSVLLKLDSVRHFYVYPDKTPFRQKIPKLVWRGAAHQPHRLRFLMQYHHDPQCDVGCVHEKSKGKPYYRPYLSIAAQLRYRYILSIEGNDVATNLKWILASRSLCLMTRPRYETWLLESRLRDGVHYVELQDDYRDLPEKLAYCEAHPDYCAEIIANANAYMRRFYDTAQERMLNLLVMQRYFALSRQL